MTTDSTAAPTVPAETAPTGPSSPPTAVTAPPGTALEIARMLDSGSIDTKHAGRLAKAGNLSTLDVAQALRTLRAAAEPKDTRSPEEKQMAAAFPEAKPADYRISYADPGQDPPIMTEELKQFDSNARGWMASAGMPKNIGDSLVNAIANVAQHTKGMTESQLEQYGYAEYDKLERVHGEKLQERLQAAALMIDHLERQQPGLKQFLNSQGFGDSAIVANMLISHAHIFHAKRGR